jgi:RNA polymerase sigma factor (sigma-70 family)
MASPALAGALRFVRSLAGTGDLRDAELLGQFVECRDEAAFAALLARHGRLVLGACRQVLGNPQDAEDAFQATFLVLARKAGSVRRGESLAAWLHRVALNVARSARADDARRRQRERQACLMAQPSPAEGETPHDWQAVLHEEVDRLPDKYRLPVVLCYLEGQTHEGAARSLGWPVGTVKGRLARARDLLRGRLAGRGVTLSAGALVLAPVVSPGLLGQTLRAAVAFAARGAAPAGAASARAVALAKGALQAMNTINLRGAPLLALVLVVGVIGYSLSSVTAPLAPRGAAAPLLRAPAPRGLDAAGDPLPRGAIARLGTVRFRHAGPVTTVAYFPGGKTIASGGQDGVIRLWAASGKELRRFPGTHFTVAPDGKTWASWEYPRDGAQKVRIWGADGKQRHELRRPGGVHAAAFSPDGKVLALGGVSARGLNQLSLWDVVTGQELPAPQMGQKYDDVYRLAFSPDGKTIATSGEEVTVRLWDVGTGQQLPSLGANGQALAWSPDGKALALEGWDRPGQRGARPLVRLFDVATRKELRRFPGLNGGVGALTFSADGKALFAGGDGVIRWWETATGKVLGAVTGHHGRVTSLALSPDGKVLISGGVDHTVRSWAVTTGKALRPCPGHLGEASCVAVSGDGRTVVSASGDGTVRLWSSSTGRERHRLPGPQGLFRALVLSPDGKTLASCVTGSWPGEGALRLWDVATARERCRPPLLERSMPVLAFSPDGRELAAAADRAVVFLDVATGKERCRTDRAEGEVCSLAYSRDGKSVAWGSSDGVFRIADAATGKELRRLGGLKESVSWCALSLDGRRLFTLERSYSGPDAVRLRDAATGNEIRRFGGDEGHTVQAAAVSPDGKVLATGGLDGTVRLWEVATGKERRKLEGHLGNGADRRSTGGVVALAWSADGKVLVSGGADTTVLVWAGSGAWE